ncbi:MAG: hypothetical protein ABIO68_06210, partial [Sphingomicrobium sp.]
MAQSDYLAGNFEVRRSDDDELFRQASAAWEAGTAPAILPRIERALASSRDYRLWHIHGLILRQLDRREDALPSLRRAVGLKPDAVKPAIALAQTSYEAGLDSVDAYGRALQLSPGNPEIVTG